MKQLSSKTRKQTLRGKKSVIRGLSLLLILSTICVFLGCQPSKPDPIDLIGDADSTIQMNGTTVGIKVDGETAQTDDRYTFADTLTITLNGLLDTGFNRYTLGYSSDSHLHGTIFYTQEGADYQEDFFLEPGVNASFSSLIDGYTHNLAGTKIAKIELRLINTESAVFELTQIDTAVWELPKGTTLSEDTAMPEDATAYIENDRFILGVDLLWGGGLSYLEDKDDNDLSVTNMLNNHDAGRLVQQSYYGTRLAPYVTAKYGDAEWPYNPVQGGDQHGNKSKLVDFAVTANSIYVKCRPLDWAQDNIYTFSYMENTYTLESEYVYVDNRFIDFSTYNHTTATNQELPAFYTISYLDTFTYYAGKDPWTNDTLTARDDLEFWGANPDCMFTLDRANTETWCAWTSHDKGYGIGLYTPGVKLLYAGRYQYPDKSAPPKSASANPTNYVAPEILFNMKNCEAFEYSYLITTGTVDTIRSVFQKNRDKVDMDRTSKVSHLDYANLVFDSKDKLGIFTSNNSCDIVQETDALKLTVSGSGSDPYIFLNYTKGAEVLYTDQYQYIVFTYMVPETNQKSSYVTELFLCTGSKTEASAGSSLTFNLICDGEYHTQIIDLSKYSKQIWPKTAEYINGIRIDFFSDAEIGDVFYLSELLLKATVE